MWVTLVCLRLQFHGHVAAHRETAALYYGMCRWNIGPRALILQTTVSIAPPRPKNTPSTTFL